MIELLQFNRVNVYDKSMANSSLDSKEIKWEHVKRLENLNCNFGSKNFLQCMSPSFKNFIRVDLSKKCFQLQDVIDDKVSYDIPEYLMSYEEDPKEMMLKFRWVNDGAIKVLNKEGVELMIDVANSEFTQLAYNKLCNYDHE